MCVLPGLVVSRPSTSDLPRHHLPLRQVDKTTHPSSQPLEDIVTSSSTKPSPSSQRRHLPPSTSSSQVSVRICSPRVHFLVFLHGPFYIGVRCTSSTDWLCKRSSTTKTYSSAERDTWLWKTNFASHSTYTSSSQRDLIIRHLA